jgi:tRNA pseudouridine13 synthase
LKGNRFDIVLRNVCTAEAAGHDLSREERLSAITTTLRNAAGCFKETGFINYFGMQRFGKFHDTHLVGIAILKGDYEKACEIIMRVKDGETERTVATREKWASRFHGVDMNDEQAVKDAETKCAKGVARELGRFMNCETSIVSSLSRNPRDYKRAFGSISKNMLSMFLHAYQSYIWNRAASFRIDDGGSNGVRVGDLVLTEDRGLSEGGNGTSGLKGKIVKQITQEDVECDNYQITDVVLPMIGTRIVFPTDNTGRFYDKILAEDALTIQDFEKIGDRELAVGGDYRKLICKPTDVDFEIKLYKDPLQPLIKTDLMNVHNASLECVDVAPDAVGASDPESNLVGLVIGFTLPPSAYATIALRELMRRPTSAQYQSELQLEGDCEASAIQN